ncbi:MAG: hypothetical protein ACLSH6_01015 [Limosilactobacillus pontis]
MKADQTEVDKVKGTASQNSSRIDVMANEIKQKVDGTTVNNILNSKGYATMSYAQTLVKQTKDQWSITATNLDAEIKDKDGVNLLKGTADFSGTWFNNMVHGQMIIGVIPIIIVYVRDQGVLGMALAKRYILHRVTTPSV